METTAYNDYLRTDVLHSLQQEVSTLDGERAFIVVCQVQELYFALIGRELRTAIERLRADDLTSALAAMDRAGAHFTGLNASWASLRWMLPPDFQAIKKGMTSVHGRSSSLQSWTFRQMLHMIGIRDETLLEPVQAMPAHHAELEESLTSRSVYDELLEALDRAGLNVPARTATAGEVDAALASFWGELMAPSRPRTLSGATEVACRFVPVLFTIAEGLAEYRHLHYAATRRTLGNRTAYYGTSGVDWLTPTLTQVAFPDLWAAALPGEEAHS